MGEIYELKQLQPKNKGLFAKINIEKGQQVMECQPLAWATLQSAKTKHCNWCFLQKQLVKCSQCKCFYYCSTECQKSDWRYHKLECKMFSKLCTQKNLSIHKQIATQFVLGVRLFVVLQENKDLLQQFYSMCSLDDFQPLEKRQHYQELSLVMMENLGLEKSEKTMSMLMKNFYILSLNAFTVQDLFYTSDGVAVGIYHPANYLNHTCNANCTQVFDGRYLKIIANETIPSGEQLTISYTSPLELQKNRSKFLKENYLFDCFCELCQVERMVSSEFAYIKCAECKEAVIRKKAVIDLLKEDDDQEDEGEKEGEEKQKQQNSSKKVEYQCAKCLKPIDIDYLKQMATKIEQLPQTIEKLKTYKQKKQQLLSMKKEFDLKHPAFYHSLQQVYLSAIDQGLLSQDPQTQKKYFSQANILLNEIIKSLPQWYKTDEAGLINIRFFSKFNEMSKLAYNMGKLAKCEENLQKAYKCIDKLSLRNKYKEIEELKTRYDQIKIEMSIAKTKAMN